jgi:outer membrane lipoprotein-sorting protein
MAFLRTVSTRRLLALVVAVVVVAGGGTAIAVAATSGGPVPRKASLAEAIHGALSGAKVTGITARITFTNQLISSSNLGQLASPLLTGATGRLWLSTDHKMLRLELQGNNGDAQLVVNGQSFWVYDPSSNTIYQGQLPAGAAGTGTSAKAKSAKPKSAKPKSAKPDAIPSLANIQTEITSLGKSLNLSGAVPGDVAGQPAYTVTVTPPHSGGLLGAAAIAFDAIHGVPLQFSVYATGSSSPVLQLTATDITYGPVDPSSFAVRQPTGAKVVNVSVPSGSAASAKGSHAKRHAKSVTGAAAVAGKVHFSLVAPSKLVGVPRRSVRLLDWGGSPAALLSYGANLGGIIVIEQKADPASTTSTGASNGRHSELALPTVSINGVTGTELDTALGTMIRFTRAGVAYTVLGSVPAVAAEAAARGL